MLADALEGDRRFGLIFLAEGTGERALPRGHVGCVAHVDAVSPFPDGRSNIVVTGEERFSLQRFVDSPLPYHVGEVAPFADLDEPPDALVAPAEELRTLFRRVARAARTLTNDHTPLPELPDDPSLLAFRIASLIDIDLPLRQRILASPSPLARLREVETVLASAIASLEQRAMMHERAKRNGQGRAPGATA
jgi:Lon protease-like protein